MCGITRQQSRDKTHSTLTGSSWPSHTLLFFSFECGEQLLVCGVKAQAVTVRRHPAPVFVGDLAHTQGSSLTLLFFSFECGEQLLVCAVKAQAVTRAVTLRLFVCDTPTVARTHPQ